MEILIFLQQRQFAFTSHFGFKVVLALGDFMSVQVHSCIGGTSVGEDIHKLDAGVHIVSGTPGRVFGYYFQHIFPLKINF